MSTAEKRRDDLEGLMYVRCASCGKWMDVKPGAATGVSHSLCEECFAREMKRIDNDAAAEGS